MLVGASRDKPRQGIGGGSQWGGVLLGKNCDKPLLLCSLVSDMVNAYR
jgi:hypothetical protein